MPTATQDVPVKTEVSKKPPMTRALSPFEEMDKWFENVLPRSLVRPLSEQFSFPTRVFDGKTPHVDVIDRDDDIVVKAELPGVEKKDLEVSATDNMLSIKATSDWQEEQDTGDYYRREISHGAFSRSVALPGDVDGSQAAATLKNGILVVTIPKEEKAKRQKISVK